MYVTAGPNKPSNRSLGLILPLFLLFVTKVADSLVFSIEKLSVRTRAQLTFSFSKHCHQNGAIKMLLCQEEAALLS